MSKMKGPSYIAREIVKIPKFWNSPILNKKYSILQLIIIVFF